jgi:CRP-like cAMP-binding protein
MEKKADDGTSVVIGHVGESDIFGELSFVDQLPAAFTVLANEVSSSFLPSCFHMDSYFSQREW